MADESNIDPILLDQDQPRPPGLDTSNNPIMDGSNKFDAPLLVKVPVRDVDWRNGARATDTTTKRCAAYGQQCGIVVPAEHQCNRCMRGGGVFASCVVNVVDGEPQAGGACMNCIWTKEAYRCSHRLGRRELPSCVLEYIAGTAQNPAAQADQNTLSTESVPTQIAQVPNPTESTADERSLAPTAEEEMWNGPLYISPFQRPPSQFSMEGLRYISEVLLNIQAHVDYDIQLLLDEIERQQQ